MSSEWNHWSENFDWENAEYIVINHGIEGSQPLGPIKGSALTSAAALAWYERAGGDIEILEASHNYSVADISDLGFLLSDLHDDEGIRLPWRADF